MSTYDLEGTIKRISRTTSVSPVLVVKMPRRGIYDVFYKDTVFAQRMLRKPPKGLVGEFHRGLPTSMVRQMLIDAQEQYK